MKMHSKAGTDRQMHRHTHRDTDTQNVRKHLKWLFTSIKPYPRSLFEIAINNHLCLYYVLQYKTFKQKVSSARETPFEVRIIERVIQ